MALPFTTIRSLAGRGCAAHHGLVTSVSTTLPVIDLRDDPRQLEPRLRAVAHDVGFFHVTGHGVPEALIGRLLAAAQRLFALPPSAKDAVAMVRSPHFRGYTRLGGELTSGSVDWREQIDIGPEREALANPAVPHLRLQGPNQWPVELPEFPGVVGEWEAALTLVGRTLLRQLANSLGSPENFFDAAFEETPATLIKVIRYPTGSDSDSGSEQGVGAHRDAGVLTLLLAEQGSRGLQVRDHDGAWIDVDPIPGAFIVNIGEMLELASGGYLRATEHRVRLTSAERISVAFFYNPRLDARLPVLTLPDELAPLARGVTSDPSNERIFSVYGRNAWKSRLRAHPDVAAAHRYLV